MNEKALSEEHYYKWKENTLILTVYLKPHAERIQIIGRHGHALKIKVKAAPVEGKANAELIDCLSDAFHVPSRQVEIVKGVQSRYKQVIIREPKKLIKGIHHPI